MGAPVGNAPQGIDVSEFQGNIDWAQVAGAGISFAMIRACDGFYQDPYFSANWSGAKAHGLVRGVYQFFRASEDGIQQADLLLSKCGTLGQGDLPPVADVETLDGQSGGTLAYQLQRWVDQVKSKTGLTPIIYTAPGLWNGYGLPSFGAETLWVANWGVSSPSVPSGWHGWTFWQWTDNGRVNGISGAVDRDEFGGTLAQLKAYAGGATGGGGGGTPPPPPPPPAGGTYTVQSGDTLSSIAAKFGISLAALEAANPQITNPNLIYVGQVINIPGGGSGGGGSSPPPSSTKTYTVQSGDTLSGIAAKFGVTLAALEAANPQITNPNLIYVGQVINIPGGGSGGSTAKTYTVQSGDTLSSIAAKFGVSLSALESANPQITNPNLIYVGQVINIP